MTQEENKVMLADSNLMPVEDLENLEMVEDLVLLDTSAPLPMQIIDSSYASFATEKKGSQYDELLMTADLSALASNSDSVKTEIKTDITFMTPDELKALPPAQMKEAKLKILNDIRTKLGSDDEMTKFEALQQFSHYIDENNIVLLNKMVTDESPHIKASIIELAAKIGNNAAISILEVLKRDNDLSISTKALDVLTEIDPRYAKPITTVDKKNEDILKKEEKFQPQPTSQDQPKTQSQPPAQDKGGLGGIFKKF